MKWRAGWKHVRAVVVLVHVVIIVLAAIPAPVGGTDRATWKNPTAQMEFAAYAKFLHVSAEEFEEKLFWLATFYMGLRDKWMTPIYPYLYYTGCDQPWRMFVGPDRFPPRFQLQWRPAAGEYTTLYEERSDTFDWRETYFRQERVRSHTYRYAWPEYRWAATQNCNYLARQVFAEKPEAMQVRCRFWKQKTRSPDQVQKDITPDPGEWVHVEEMTR